jgi:hypothetical protein
MLSVEIKINETTLKKFIAVRQDSFLHYGATHRYTVELVEEDQLDSGYVKRDRYMVGNLEHRYNAGAVSLVEKMLKLARKKGMHR